MMKRLMAGLLALVLVAPATAYQPWVEKQTFELPAYTTVVSLR